VRDGDVLLGHVLALTGSGYGGELKLLVYYGVDGAIRAARLVENTETPGLGKKAETAGYMAMFTGTGAARPVPVSKEMLAGGATGSPGGRAAVGAFAGRVPWIRASRAGLGAWLFGDASGGTAGGADAVTGATITFRGVAAALAEGAQFVKGLGGRK
jgi:electron transport complex protein RnfG